MKRAIWSLVDDVIYVYTFAEVPNDFYMQQCVHAAWAFTQLIPYLPTLEEQHRALLHFAKAIMAAYIARGCPAFPSPPAGEVEADIIAEQKAAEEAAAAAAAKKGKNKNKAAAAAASPEPGTTTRTCCLVPVRPCAMLRPILQKNPRNLKSSCAVSMSGTIGARGHDACPLVVTVVWRSTEQVTRAPTVTSPRRRRSRGSRWRK